MSKISLTTTLPYVNAVPHVGHALEFVQADTFARYYRLMGNEVFFNTGTDEHGIKIYRKALEAGKEPQEYVDEYAEHFKTLINRLNLSYDAFIRTTDANHKRAAQAFWRRCAESGDIYKKEYKVKYCVGCELEKTDSELVDGKCPEHPTTPIETINEENYFFRFSKYKDALLELYAQQSDFVIPVHRQNEIRAFIERGPKDFSISRIKEKMPWGVPVPDDDEHVMYVWFDALVNYVSTLGWPDKSYADWWPSIQFAGKDNLRQQTAMWQAMLLSAGLEPSKQVFIHGFITSEGQKMSKSVGNVIDPMELVEQYGTDAVRYFFLRHIHPFEDTDMTHERFHEIYTANLVNGLGNLVSRVMKMATSYGAKAFVEPKNDWLIQHSYAGKYVEKYEFNKALDEIWGRISELDSAIQEKQPFKMIKENKEAAIKEVQFLVDEVFRIGYELQPFMPDTAKTIMHVVREHTMPEPMFPRL
jgi:methionyl-tRNA synthetase